MYWPVLESVGDEGGSGEIGPESVCVDSDPEFSLLRPRPRAGLVRHPGCADGNSAPSNDVIMTS